MIASSSSIPRSDLLTTVQKCCQYIHAVADLSRRDRLFPADPMVYMTNPLSMGYGAVGVAYALQRLEGTVDSSFRAWILSQPMDAERCPPGLYMGLAGVAWGLWEIGAQQAAIQAMHTAYRHPLLWEDATLFFGVAGYGLAALRMFLGTGEQIWLERAVQVGEYLLRTRGEREEGVCWADRDGNIRLGYARGGSGIGLYLMYLGLATGDDVFVKVGTSAIEFDVAHAYELPGGLVSIPRDPVGLPVSTVSHYWLDGTAGVCTALVRLWHLSGSARHLQSLERLIPDTYRKYVSFPGLFRGLSGLGNCLLDVYDFTGRERYLEEALRVATGVNLYAIPMENGVAWPGEQLFRISTDFGTGSAGIALFLHRLAHAHEQRCNFNLVLDQLLPGNSRIDM